jgi:DNA-binding CsgD family transcriptional regulator
MRALDKNINRVKKFVDTQTAIEFKHLYENGESTCSIARKFGYGDNTVNKHLRNLGVKLRTKREAIKLGIKNGRIKLPRRFPRCILPTSSKLTTEKAYALGVLAGDGSIDYCPKRKRYTISLGVIDKEFADEFERCLHFTYGITPKKRRLIRKHAKRSDVYLIRLNSRAACEDLLGYGSFKEREWNMPQAVNVAPPDVKGSYLKGFFDSEGCVDMTHRLIYGSSSNLPGLQSLSTLLTEFGIKTKIWRGGEGTFNLAISGRQFVELFAKHVGFTIKRKEQRLKQILVSYKPWLTPPTRVLELEPEMRRLRDLGLTYREIAEKVNLGTMTVWNHLNSMR